MSPDVVVVPESPHAPESGSIDPIELAELISRLRRAMRRGARRSAPDLGLSVAQLELMNAVASMPTARSGELAESLHIAANSVSTLTNDLVGRGMVERSRGASDRRTVTLALTPAGRRALDRWQAINEELVTDAFSSLSTIDRGRIRDAIPPLQRLVEQLDVGDDTDR